MFYCPNCGNQLFDGVRFCGKCGSPVSGSDDQTNGSQEMYEEFIPALGVGIKFAFTKDSLIFDNDTYPYSKLKPITIVNAGTMLTNGSARTATDSGESILLAYNYKDNDRFTRVMNYANEQIEKAHGSEKSYKYVITSPSGSKVEVYDDYLTVYYVSSGSNAGSQFVSGFGKGLGLSSKGLSGKITGGIGKVFDTVGGVTNSIGNRMKGGATGNIIMFTDLNIQFDGADLIINEYSIPISPQDKNRVNEIITFIQDTTRAKEENPDMPEIEEEPWERVEGKEMIFDLYGRKLKIPESFDVFNTYRKEFKRLAEKYTEKAKEEYRKRIRDFVSFVEFFPKVYGEGMFPIGKRAIDILVSEGIWSVTVVSFLEQHTTDFHYAQDVYEALMKGAQKTAENNLKATANVMSYVPRMGAMGFGFKNALKATAKAEVFNMAMDGITKSALQNSVNLKPQQQAELYGRINFDNLFKAVFSDYWNMLLSLITVLNKNGQSISFPTKDNLQKAQNIFANIKNPNFPQDKLLETTVQLFALAPYNTPEYYDFAESRFGRSDELTRMKKYFGYED